MTRYTSSLNPNLDRVSQLRKREMHIGILTFLSLLFSFLMLTDLYDSVFVSRDAQLKFLFTLLAITVTGITLFVFFLIQLRSFSHKSTKIPPSDFLSTMAVRKRWEALSDDEFCIVLLATQPQIYKVEEEKISLTVGNAYTYGDIAAKLRRIINDNSYVFDSDEIIQIEETCSFFTPVVPLAQKKISTKSSKLEKRAESYRKWPIYLTEIMLTYMLKDSSPLKHFSEDELIDLVETYRRENNIPNGNSYGLATSFVVDEWFPTLPDSFRIPKNVAN